MQIIVDSTCDLPRPLMERYRIRTLPLRVTLEGREYRDRVDLSIDEVYERMRRGVLPRTAQVSPEDMLEVFLDCAGRGEDFLYLAFSSVLSGTCNVAKMLVEGMRERYPGVRMEVLDTKSGAMAIGLCALEAALMAEAGYGYDEVLDQARFMVEHTEHVFALADLDWLAKGGRINRVISSAGSALNLRPLLDVEEGYLKVIGVARGRKKMLETLVDLTARRSAAFPGQVIGVCHAGDPEAADAVLGMLKARGIGEKYLMDQIGCVLGSHLGLGGVGILFFNARPPFYSLDYE